MRVREENNGKGVDWKCWARGGEGALAPSRAPHGGDQKAGRFFPIFGLKTSAPREKQPKRPKQLRVAR